MSQTNRLTVLRRMFEAAVVAILVAASPGRMPADEPHTTTDPEIARLINETSSADWHKRMAAVESLGQHGVKAKPAIAALAIRLADTDPPLQRSTTHVVELGPTVGEKAAAALAAIGPDAEPALRGALAAGSLQARCCAALALALLGTKDSAAELAKLLPSALQASQDGRHRSAPRHAMIKALGKSRDSQMIPALRHALEKESWEYNCVAAVRAIAEIGGSEAVHALRDTYSNKSAMPGARRVALRLLVKTLGPGAKHDVQTMLRGDMQELAMELLPQVADEALAGEHRHSLHSSNSGERLAAVRAIAAVGSPKVVPDLIAALRVADSEVQKTALDALRTIRDPSALPGLLEFIQNSKKEAPRGRALNALAAIPGDESKAAMCLLLLTDPEASLRLSALQCLKQRSNTDPTIRTAVKLAMESDKDQTVRDLAQQLTARWSSLELAMEKAREASQAQDAEDRERAARYEKEVRERRERQRQKSGRP